MVGDREHTADGSECWCEKPVVEALGIRMTQVHIPVTLPDGTVVGKACIVEGEDPDTSVLVELENIDPTVVDLLKNALVGLSIIYNPAVKSGS